ncbi:reverse transcriptase domain-containing protein [Tanacetum coccineum]
MLKSVLGFQNSSTSAINSVFGPDCIDSLFPLFHSFDGGDFILEEIEDCLINDSIPPRIADDDFDPEGDIRLLEELLNNDSSSPFPSKELHFENLYRYYFFYDDPPELELIGITVQSWGNVRPKLLPLPLVRKDYMTDAQAHYTTTEKELLAVVYAFEKFRPYLVLSKTIVYTDHSALKYLLDKQDVKPRLLGGFSSFKNLMSLFVIKKERRIRTADHLSRSCLSMELLIVFLPRIIHKRMDKWVSNRGLKRILERTVGENRASWSDKLDGALWAFRTTFKTPIGCTPYKLVYGKACHLPIKLEHKAYWALNHCNFDLKTASDYQKVQINELNKLRDQAYKNSLIHKEKTKKIHDSKIRNCVFNVGDRVLLFNSRLKIF